MHATVGILVAVPVRNKAIGLDVLSGGLIGARGKIPWFHPGDLQRFKRLTMGHTLVMGRKTYASIGRPLPGRRTIVVSSGHASNALAIYNFERAKTFEEALVLARTPFDGQKVTPIAPYATETWCVGGRGIYEAALKVADVLDVTFVPEAGVYPYMHAEAVRFPQVQDTEWETELDATEHPDAPGCLLKRYRRRGRFELVGGR
jgi:dihydrofolate reductase